MREKGLNLMGFLSIALLAFLLPTACSDSDEAGQGGLILVDVTGLWTTSYEENNSLWVFESDQTGTLYEQYDNANKGVLISHFAYEMDQEKHMLDITPIDSENDMPSISVQVRRSDDLLELVGNITLSLRSVPSMPSICDKPVPRTFLLHDKEIHFFSKYCIPYIVNYDDDNDFIIETDASWLTLDSMKVMGMSQNSLYGTFHYVNLYFTPEKNMEREERTAVLTVTKRKTGESYSSIILQQAYRSLETDWATNDFVYQGVTYFGAYFNSSSSDGKEAFLIFVESYDDAPVHLSTTASWVKLLKTDEIGGGFGKYNYRYSFSIAGNTGYDRMMNLIFYKDNGDHDIVTLVQGGRRGPEGGYKGDGDCTHCNGSGICSVCNGKGQLLYDFGGLVITCSNCKGTGQCRFCDGTGWTPDKPTVDTGSDSGSGGSSSGSSNVCKWCQGMGSCRNALSPEANKYYCRGSGKCKWCGGDGWYYGMGYKKMMCTNCNRSGNNSTGKPGDGKCSYCGGNGKCNHCGGTGKP